MEAIVKTQMEGIKFGELQIHGHVAVIPMISTNGSGPDYLTMKEALEGQFLTVSGDDVREHGLPSDMEAKDTSPNYRKFVERHGVHVAELDAAPVVLLQGKLRDAIESCLDMNLFRAELAKERDDAGFIAATKKAVMKAMAR